MSGGNRQGIASDGHGRVHAIPRSEGTTRVRCVVQPDVDAPLFIATRPLAKGELITLEVSENGCRLVEESPQDEAAKRGAP